jgi:antitoxin YefM
MASSSIDVKTYSEARANLKSLMDQVVDDHVPVVISRRKGEPVIMMSLSDWNGWQETNYLNASAANRRRLDESMAQAEAGQLIETTLDEHGVPRPIKRDAAA